MRILAFDLKGLRLYDKGALRMILFAEDRITDGSFTHRLQGTTSPLGIVTAIGISGINASGKTTDLRLLSLIINIARGASLGTQRSTIDSLMDILEPTITARIIFEEDGDAWLLNATLRRADHNEATADSPLVFEKERLCQYAGRSLSKIRLRRTIDGDEESWVTVATRGMNKSGDEKELAEDVKRFLPPDRSLMSGILRAKETMVTICLQNPLQMSIPVTPPSQVVRLFDPTIEHLEVSDHQFHIKFRNEKLERNCDPSQAMAMISAGTFRGTSLAQHAIETLAQGGYLLFDEIENSINKQLVFAIIDLFSSPATNPHGAVLVFSTHYPELLDHFTRKDNIWFAVRHENAGFQLVRYNKLVTRGELKKSVQFMSGALQGTAPSAASISALRSYVKDTVHG